MKQSFYFLFLSILIFAGSSNPLLAQSEKKIFTAADYAHAEKFMGYNTAQLVNRASVKPNWLPDGRFWYCILTTEGSEFVVVDPKRKTKSPAFDQQKLADALSKSAGTDFDPNKLPFTNFSYSTDGKTMSFVGAQKNWTVDLKTYEVTDTKPFQSPGKMRRDISTSPDGKRSVFIKDYNLWLLQDGKETQLTTDGIKDYGYATDNAGWKHSDRAIVSWSPDSKKVATYQQDQRNTSDMYLVTTNVGKPTLQQWKYPLPGDKEIATLRRVIIDLDNSKVIPLKLAPDPHRSTLCDDISCRGGDFTDVAWSNDGTQLAFVSTSRDHKDEKLFIANSATGELKEIFTETAATQFESGHGSINWRFLSASNEIIWFSERDNWGHLYLYDAATGKLKNQITHGDWVVENIQKIDEKARVIYFLASGKEAGENPYFEHLYKIGFDGKNMTPLTPEAGNHTVSLSSSGDYFVDTYSKQDTPPTVTLRSLSGKLVMPLEKTDISRLTATGWKPPIPIVVKARDGQIDLYGLMFTPTTLDPNKKYPVVNYIYPGPQGGSIGSWSFESATGDDQALAELGFIVIAIEGTCNPQRSKSFHDMCYGNMADNTLPDQIVGIKQLAAKYPYIDLDRVGIWGHSGGGFATATAMFRYPDFYKVGIAESGNHDNRNYEDDWGERYIGLDAKGADGKSIYEDQANQNFAKNLKGKLLLAHGMLDDNVPPYNTLLVVEALEKANKDYDLIIFPNSHHGYGEYSLYMTRRRWDYFIKNLQDARPPKEYEMKAVPDPRALSITGM